MFPAFFSCNNLPVLPWNVCGMKWNRIMRLPLVFMTLSFLSWKQMWHVQLNQKKKDNCNSGGKEKTWWFCKNIPTLYSYIVVICFVWYASWFGLSLCFYVHVFVGAWKKLFSVVESLSLFLYTCPQQPV